MSKNPQEHIVQVGNPLFRSECKTLNKSEISNSATKNLISSLTQTVTNVGGVGMAAPQVGVQKQVFVVSIQPTKYRPDLPQVPLYTVINPEILSASKKDSLEYEGCFSVAEAGLFCQVKRPSEISVRYLDETGKTMQRTLNGFEARVFQHEYDHLFGKIFLDNEVLLHTAMSSTEYRAMQARNIAS